MINYIKVANLLKRAKQVLIVRGWTRGDYTNRGRCCSLGAIQAVTKDYEYDREARRLLSTAAGVEYVAHWNDQQKSKAPVLAAFDRAIKLAYTQAREAKKETKQ